MPMKRKIAFGGAVLAAGCGAWGALTEVTDRETFSVSTTGGGLTVATSKLTDWPTDIPQPIFWFDCTQTNDWTVNTGADGSTYVTRIPSLVGDRFLTTDMSLEGMVWKGASNKPKPPKLVAYDDLVGGPVLDFGANGSHCGMSFDPVAYDGAAPVNVMKNIGALVGLWGSQEGGGYILGGGLTANNQDAWNYNWVRGWDSWTSVNGGTVKWWCTVAGAYGNAKAAAPGYWAHDGWFSSAELTGLNGGWEVIGMSMNDATWSATGVGLGDTRNGYGRDGGQRIGELMIFDSTLTRDQMTRAQVWMRQKWFGKKTRGWNGDANLGTFRIATAKAVRAILDVPEGEVLTVQSLEGGRYGGYTTAATAAVKAGEGVLAVNRAENFAAPVELAGGTLRLSGHRQGKIAAADDLPAGLYIHFDVSETESLKLSEPDENGVRYLEEMANLGPGTVGATIDSKTTLCPIFAQVNRGYKTSDQLRPAYVARAFGSGMPMLDFGPRRAGSKNGAQGTVPGRYLCFYRRNPDGTSTLMSINGCGTVVAVVNAEYGGGHLGNGPLARDSRWITLYNQQLIRSSAITSKANLPMSDRNVSAVYVDGRRLDVTSGFPHRGTHVIAYQVQPGEINAIGAEQYYTEGETSASGGVILGEILYWKRTLSNEELSEVQEYLSKKWLKRDLPGYDTTSVAKAVPDLQSVRVTGAAKIEVPAGRTAKVGALSTDAPLVKTGAGTLVVAPGSDASQLTVAEGSVRVAPVDPQVTDDEKCRMAAGASCHLDASYPDNFLLAPADGKNYIQSWYSSDGVPAYSSSTSTAPWLNDDAEALLNGKPVVDFGPYSANSAAGSGYLVLSKPLDGVRSVFIVRGTQAGGGSFLGETSDVTDWCRDGAMRGTLEIPIAASASGPVKNGRFYQDGVLADITKTCPKGTYEINDVHTLAGTHVSALAVYKTNYMRGGQRIAEVIVYERPLSEREIVATRNYLTQKWFPGRPLQDLPAETVPTAVTRVGDVALTNDVTIAADVPLAVTRVTGAETLTKTGTAQLVVRELAARVNVTEGSLRLDPLPVVPGDPELVTEGRLLHLDATQGLETETNDMGVAVLKWNSRVEDGWAAVAAPNGGTTVTNPPTLLVKGLNGLPVVKMANYESVQQSMNFVKDGVPTRLEGIRSAFWVIGSQEGGGFLMGGGYNPRDGSVYCWHRGGSDAGGKASDGKVNNHALDELEQATWTTNGAPTTASAGLSGGYDVVSMVMRSTADYAASADGLAFDGRSGFQGRIGRQRLAELIAYDRALSADETDRVIGYLRRKWGFAVSATSCEAEVTLAQGTALQVVDGQYLKTLAGSGTVDGDVTVGGFIADATAENGLTVSGTLTVAANPTVTLVNLPTELSEPIVMTVATATAFADVENLMDAVFVGVPEDCRAKAHVVNGALVVTVKPIVGLTVIIR